ncbi:GAF domain-containing protein [Streptomyces sp. NPDC052292]|uniref:GAF domain-containing protein n=1 Tax=Streptomyces sp. NPDC052292 TaxID=3155053 RepID=UPI003412B36F
MSREQQLAEALVGPADSFADDIDPVVLVDRPAQRCVEITGADAVGIMVVSARGDLRTLAVTDDQAGFLELFQLKTDQGPCLDCYREGHRVDVRDMAADAGRRPQVVPFALEIGFRAAHTLPLRAHGQTVGAVNLLLREPGGPARSIWNWPRRSRTCRPSRWSTGRRNRCAPRTSPAASRPRWPAVRRSAWPPG